MTQYQRTSLAALNAADIAAVYSTVYEDYVVPFNVSADWARQHIARHDIDLDRSPLWLDADGQTVAMAALGVRGKRSWVGGFGVARPYRGRGLSRALVEEIIDIANRGGLKRLQLEVITTNHIAIRTYQRAGFEHARDLLILSREPEPLTVDIDSTLVVSADPAQVLTARAGIGPSPDWSREPSSLAALGDLEALIVGDADAPLALALYRLANGALRLHDLAASDVAAAQALLASIIERWPETAISLVNEPEGSEVLPALFDAGWVEVMRQHEMVLDL
jgi:GNAT superfamily N-acetyltransferase